MEHTEFLFPVYIKRNDREIKDLLEDMGYVASDFYNEAEPYIFTSGHRYYTTSVDVKDDCIGCNYGPYGIICTGNLEMFMAIAALTDDNDLNQWFISENNEQWFICDYVSLDEMKRNTGNHMTGYYLKNARKATLKEIIEKFNK